LWIWVEGCYDVELVEKVWGDDLCVEGVVVEMLDGVDDFVVVVCDFVFGFGWCFGVLVDYLVLGLKELWLVVEVVF